MAISPTVAAYQDQMANTSSSNESDEVAFNKTFGDHAYKQLRAKYNDITPFIITFKIIDLDLDKGNAIASFILKYGQDVVYIPTVLAQGQIESLEMVYNKSEDYIQPLIKPTVEDIVAENTGEDPSLPTKKIDVEGTKTLFRNMFRPPVQTMPVFSSTTGIENLPNAAKKALSDCLTSNPELLAKIASFYPIEVLTKKLALSPEEEHTKLAEDLSHIDKIITMDKLSSEVAELLTDEERQELRTKGYLLTKEAEEAPNTALSTKDLPVQMINNLNIREIYATEKTNGSGKLLYLNGTELKFVPFIIDGDILITDNGYKFIYGSPGLAWNWKGRTPSLLVSDFKEGISTSDLKACTVYEMGTSPNSISTSSKSTNRKFAVYKKGSTYGIKDIPFFADKKSVNDEVYLESSCNSKVIFTPKVEDNCIYLDDNTALLPIDSKVITDKRDERSYVSSLSLLHKILMNSGKRIRIVGDSIISTSDKTASDKRFSKTADIVQYLQEEYQLDKTGIERIMTSKDAIVFTKHANIQPYSVEQPSDSMYSTGYYPTPQIGVSQMQDAPVNFGQNFAAPNEDLLSSAAELNDQDIMDTGMLASLAGEDNIKGLLVDMFPQFQETCTSLGKTIIMFTYHKEEFEDYYGREEYEGTLLNIRRVFRQLGEVLFDLKKYTNMV